MTIEKCRTCKHTFTTGKDRWYCELSLADKDDCGEYENKYTPGACNFCSTIYPDEDTQDILFAKGKYSGVYIDEFITIDNEGKYCINIDPGDPYETGYLDDINFCPYCGRKLEEKEND